MCSLISKLLLIVLSNPTSYSIVAGRTDKTSMAFVPVLSEQSSVSLCHGVHLEVWVFMCIYVSAVGWSMVPGCWRKECAQEEHYSIPKLHSLVNLSLQSSLWSFIKQCNMPTFWYIPIPANWEMRDILIFHLSVPNRYMPRVGIYPLLFSLFFILINLEQSFRRSTQGMLVISLFIRCWIYAFLIANTWIQLFFSTSTCHLVV